jgi:hypothetical protein
VLCGRERRHSVCLTPASSIRPRVPASAAGSAHAAACDGARAQDAGVEKVDGGRRTATRAAVRAATAGGPAPVGFAGG